MTATATATAMATTAVDCVRPRVRSAGDEVPGDKGRVSQRPGWHREAVGVAPTRHEGDMAPTRLHRANQSRGVAPVFLASIAHCPGAVRGLSRAAQGCPGRMRTALLLPWAAHCCVPRDRYRCASVYVSRRARQCSHHKHHGHHVPRLLLQPRLAASLSPVRGRAGSHGRIALVKSLPLLESPPHPSVLCRRPGHHSPAADALHRHENKQPRLGSPVPASRRVPILLTALPAGPPDLFPCDRVPAQDAAPGQRSHAVLCIPHPRHFPPGQDDRGGRAVHRLPRQITHIVHIVRIHIVSSIHR